MSLLSPLQNQTALSSALPWAESFFAGAIQSRHLAHAYVLKGKAPGAMYNLTLQIAKTLNCQNRPSQNDLNLNALACGHCTQCKWISGNAHPAVLTVSRLTYQVNDKGELMSADELEKHAKKSTTTQIKTDQIGRLIQQLGVSSEYKRVVIFTDAEELPGSIASDVIAPFDWQSIEANADKSFHIRPLARDLFNAFSVNKFLKTLEEPPPHTLFFFIAETEEQLLETIVSRCQVVPCVPAQTAENNDALLSPETTGLIEELLSKIDQKQDAYTLASGFDDFCNNAGLNSIQGLSALQQILRQRFQANAFEQAQFVTYRKWQQAVDQALRMLDAKTNEKQVILDLFLTLSSR